MGDKLALCPELEHSLSLLEPGGESSSESDGRARPPCPWCSCAPAAGGPGAAPGAGRSMARRAAASCCAVSAGLATPRVPSVPPAIPPSLPSAAGAAAFVAVSPEPKVSELPGECEWGGPVPAGYSPGGVGGSRRRRRGEARAIETLSCSGC